MKIIFLSVCFIIFFAVGIFAQVPRSTPVPLPTPNQAEIMRQQRRQQEDFERLRKVRDTNSPGGSNRINGATDYEFSINYDFSVLYRKTSPKELQLLAPKPEDVRKYEFFLRQPNTGIIKLVADKGCSENTNIVVATPECLAYSMPGSGSSYSFRVGDYRIPRLADITFTDNSFQATGIRLHGFFAELGNIPLEQVNLQTKGLEFPISFKAEPDFQKAKEMDRKLIEGITENGFSYRRAIRAKDDTTYVLRSIAYRGKYFHTMQNLTYNELDFDKRMDVIIAFRIISRDADGSVTILWKQLAKKDSPKTKWKNDEQNNKNSNSNFTAKKK